MRTKSAQKIVAGKKSSGAVLELVKTIIYAVLIALVVRTVAYEPFNIPSGSMIPTLLVGDYLFVSKFSYGYTRYSLPFGLPLFSGRVFFHSPQRGDVAVFKLPTNTSVDYIKRIIGLPGDHIQVREGELYINDQLVPRRKIEDEQCPDRPFQMCTLYTETLPNGVAHPILKQRDEGEMNNTRVYDVPAGHYFAMGDNRDNSEDSRVLSVVGYIPGENLVGRAEFLFYSTDGSARWWEFWKWPFAIRYNRLFQSVH
ncbi:MAG: signal peptidase I [Alphaproteobacteria bacterium]|nr:signal peptidase I [Alphaproteobacteria bacterium]